jgi:hypothetical protein
VSDELPPLTSVGPDPIEAAEQLAALLDLPSVDVDIRGARVSGQGSRASVQIQLSNGEELEFDTVRDMIRPQSLIAEVAARTGACPQLKQPQAARAVALVRALAEQLKGVTGDDIARSWGSDYLQAVDVIDVDMNDQTERWGAFAALARASGALDGGKALRHVDGTRYVRTGWFRRFVKEECDHTIAPRAIHTRMERVGWQIPGTEGRVKASRPKHRDRLSWSFYIVPAGWDADDE